MGKTASCQNQKFGHNFPYPGADCLNCGINQRVLSRLAKTEHSKNSLKERLKNPNKRLHSKIHLLADEISKHFGEEEKFGMYLGIIKRIGFDETCRIFSETKQAKIPEKNKVKLFMWSAARIKKKKLLG